MERKIEWTKVQRGLYRNNESGVEIEQVGGLWHTTRPLAIQSNGNEKAWQRPKSRLGDAMRTAELMWVLAVHRPMVDAAYEAAYEEELTRQAVRARDAGVTPVQIQDILEAETTTERRLALVKAFADDAEKAAAKAVVEAARQIPPNDLDHRTTAELVANIVDGTDPFADDDETEEILRDVVVAQTMEWVDRGSDPTDLAGILKAAGDLRAWMSAHPID